MMKKYFVLGFIALSALVTCHPAVSRADSDVSDGVFGAARSIRDWFGEHGTASYYGARQNGRRSADGAIYDQRLLTAAHPWLPFGTRIRVTLGETGRSVIVTITDRLHSRRRIVDLSVAAAQELGMIRRGLAQVSLAPA